MAQQKARLADHENQRQDRIQRMPVDKYQARRIELAEAALETLANLGYARTSLREIAQNSEFTHGVLHYYFTDKLDLITCSIRHFKAKCVTRYDEVIAQSRSREELAHGFLEKLAETLREEPKMHCLWYDLRAQALFEGAFRSDVVEIDRSLEDMVWRILTRYAELGSEQVALSPGAAYALLDGLFQKYLLQQVAGDAGAIPALQDEVRQLLPMCTYAAKH